MFAIMNTTCFIKEIHVYCGNSGILKQIRKIRISERAGGVVQVVEHLSCKCEALGSNPPKINKNH
jgi:hypothetical protein